MEKAFGASVAVSLMLSGVSPKHASSREAAATDTKAQSVEMRLSDIIRRLEGQGYHDFRESERVRGHYEITARNENGKRARVYGNSVTGELRR